jgi:hypothetical protein
MPECRPEWLLADVFIERATLGTPSSHDGLNLLPEAVIFAGAECFLSIFTSESWQHD